jgi:L-alanine-DL-glutamate epimerase-like enolase superfamily enzyme
MVESSIGVTAAAHLAGLADWVDLDGHLYLAEDDFEGIEFANEGRLRMPTRAGIGAVRRSQATSQADASRLQTSPLKGRYL